MRHQYNKTALSWAGVLALLLALSTTLDVQAQSSSIVADQLVESSANDTAVISLEDALARVSDQHDVSFLYERDALSDLNVRSRKALPARLSGQLNRLLTSHELTYEQVGERSYAIVPQAESSGAASPAAADDPGTIEGTIVNPQGEALPGVQVVLQGTMQGTTTDAEGQYTIPDVEPGTYTVRATFVGFAPAESEVTV